jgi:hypothetical protein
MAASPKTSRDASPGCASEAWRAWRAWGAWMGWKIPRVTSLHLDEAGRFSKAWIAALIATERLEDQVIGVQTAS